MKTIFGYIFIATLSVMGTLYAISWQEEDLTYEVTDPVFFGEVIYQNVRIGNQGWNPAENVKFQFKSDKSIKEGKKEYRAYPPMNISMSDNDLIIGGYDRIRRNELVTVTFLSHDNPITPESIVIKSDRNIARLMISGEESISWVEILSAISVSFFAFIMLGFVLAIVFRVNADYKKRALEAKRRVEEANRVGGQK